jgi:hypothetical protein
MQWIKSFYKSNKRRRNKNVVINLVETGAEISGSVAGSVVGGIVAGPAGMIIGGATGPLLSRALRQVANEIKERLISPREEIRIGAAYAFAINKLNENLNNGKQFRTDIFEIKFNQRTDSEEIFEGIILNVQKEYEERKVKFLGNLYANICTNPIISKEHANQLIKTASSSSYRQLCILQLFYQRNTTALSSPPSNRLHNYRIEKGDLIVEIRDLQQMGLLRVLSRLNDVDDNSSPILQEDISISHVGVLFCEMLSLSEINKGDIDHLKADIYEVASI